jgi:phosphotransferase system HPr (HPr) family protein
LSDVRTEAVVEVEVPNKEGLHARPVMRFVDLASTFQAGVTVVNITRDGETVDGKSAMHMMLLEATQGCVLRIEARGEDAREAVDALASLVKAGFKPNPPPSP